jgi:HK97 family phage portal protein
LRYSQKTLSLADSAESFAGEFFQHKYNGFLSTEQDIFKQPRGAQKEDEEPKSQAEKIRTAWDAIRSKGGIPILGNNFKWNNIGHTFRDTQQLETRKNSVIEICRLFGVSPVKVFDFQYSTLSNFEQQQTAFVTDTLHPILEKLNCEVNCKLLPPSKQTKFEVELDVNDLTRADKKATADYYSTMLNAGALTVNEARFELGLPPVKDGDIIYKQIQYQPIGTKIDNQKTPNNND